MKTPIEVNKVPATFCLKTGIVEETIRQETDLVTLCAWCSNDLTPKLIDAGYKVRHGICMECSKGFIK